MESDREKIVFSFDTQYFRRPSQRVSLIIATNSLLFRKVVPGLSTTARISSNPNILDRIVKVFIILFYPLLDPPFAPPLGMSLRHSLHMLLNTMSASVKYRCASVVLCMVFLPSTIGVGI